MAQRTVEIPDETDKQVEHLLKTHSIDFDAFAIEAIRRSLLHQTVLDLQDQAGDLSPEQADALANEAVRWVRARPH